MQVNNKKNEARSECPMSRSLDIFGDKWTLLIIRDLVFKGYRFYNEFVSSEEKIATNILSDRLKKLELNGIIKSEKYELNKTKKVYKLTETGIDLIPVLVELLLWGYKYDESLLNSEERIGAFSMIKEDKEGFIKNVIASVKNFDATNFC